MSKRSCKGSSLEDFLNEEGLCEECTQVAVRNLLKGGMMRSRTEDLGKLAVMLEAMLEHPIFDHFTCRAKDYADVFMGYSDALKAETIHNLAYQIEDMRSLICDCEYIAAGRDYTGGCLE